MTTEPSTASLSMEQTDRASLSDQQLICTFDNNQPIPKQTVRLSTVPITKSIPSKKGYALILNHYKYENGNLGKRESTKHDVTKLEETFDYFNVETDVKDDLKLSEIKEQINILKKTDFSNYKCFIMVILTHGDQGDILNAYDETYNFIEEIEDALLLDHVSLSDKPKIFVIQACRGNQTIPVIGINRMQDNAPQPHQSVPVKRNMIKFYATYDGYAAFRNPEGSPFIQKLCDTLREKETESIYDVMMEVTKDISASPDYYQLPTLTSTLTGPFSFHSL